MAKNKAPQREIVFWEESEEIPRVELDSEYDNVHLDCTLSCGHFVVEGTITKKGEKPRPDVKTTVCYQCK